MMYSTLLMTTVEKMVNAKKYDVQYIYATLEWHEGKDVNAKGKVGEYYVHERLLVQGIRKTLPLNTVIRNREYKLMR